jgi:predicted amidohydrolase
MGRVIVATCQFPVGGDVSRNARAIRGLMRAARARGAHAAHFCETALSGYAGVDIPTLEGYDWERHADELKGIMALAAELSLWVIVGSTHRLTGPRKPHNSLYIVNDNGRLVNRYDKRFCTGSDLRHYTPGSAFTVFDMHGVRCGALICYDFRFPELYREYYKRGVKLMFHSFHMAHGRPVTAKDGGNILGHIAPASVFAHAASNAMWISAPNSSARVSRWSTFVARPDGMLSERLPLHRTGMIVSTIDTARDFYDAPGKNRDRAVRGLLSSLPPVKDPRSQARRAI